MEMDADRRLGRAHPTRDLRDVEVENVPEDDRGSLIRREAPERLDQSAELRGAVPVSVGAGLLRRSARSSSLANRNAVR